MQGVIQRLLDSQAVTAQYFDSLIANKACRDIQ